MSEEQTNCLEPSGSEFALSEGFGHPWTRDAGLDLLEIRSVSEEALTKAIHLAFLCGWNLWIRDNTGNISAAMYRKSL